CSGRTRPSPAAASCSWRRPLHRRRLPGRCRSQRIPPARTRIPRSRGERSGGSAWAPARNSSASATVAIGSAPGDHLLHRLLPAGVDWGAGIAPDPVGDNRDIAGFGARLTHIAAGGHGVALWQVDDLERYVDRHALLAAADAPEPPYWAHLWSGARVLADAVPRRRVDAVELGCGLGL